VTLVLAADVGGTKIDMALYEARLPLVPVRESVVPSQTAGSLTAVLDAFLEGTSVAAAAFGIPGPVIDDTVVTTNLPWKIDGKSLRLRLGTERVRLMNDLEATALGALHLPASSFRVLQEGKPRPGHVAVIAAGTGLGQAYLFWDGVTHTPAATEGGHADFAPREILEDELLEFLRRKFGRVSWERVVSGPGLWNVFEFLDTEKNRAVAPATRDALRTAEDKSAVIGKAGVAGTCPACTEAVEMFVRMYGAQAGNLALTVMATGGVLVGGGIVGKLLPSVGSSFVQAFRAKGRYEPFMGDLPVKVILDSGAGRLGAALAALSLL
jgi:glucokinase